MFFKNLKTTVYRFRKIIIRYFLYYSIILFLTLIFKQLSVHYFHQDWPIPFHYIVRRML